MNLSGYHLFFQSRRPLTMRSKCKLWQIDLRKCSRYLTPFQRWKCINCRKARFTFLCLVSVVILLSIDKCWNSWSIYKYTRYNSIAVDIIREHWQITFVTFTKFSLLSDCDYPTYPPPLPPIPPFTPCS